MPFTAVLICCRPVAWRSAAPAMAETLSFMAFICAMIAISGLTRFIHKVDAAGNLVDRRHDPHLHVAGGFSRTLGQRSHLIGHDRETLARLTGARGLNACIEGQQVGLEGNPVDDRDDFRNLFGGPFDAAHRVHGAADDTAAALGLGADLRHEAVRAIRVVSGLTDRGSHLVHGGCGFREIGGLLLGTSREVSED